ncbi:cytochrome c biogenesis protein CcdA [uncultured Mitsuokella sp.]|uniref:cytochrome c biogenesis CcdA family protein n=1 Tax=uncultured Mitsuokella sp. TaxID=453120 RepID=UPI002621A109|nr:cytochrome c biogenesis protein CcdA [uncultured Mitsuokella sp.]
MEALSVWAAFLAGMLSLFSPCVLPMLPTFLLIFAGSSDGTNGRSVLARNLLAFLIGFAITFLIIGATATSIGQLALRHWETLERAGGALLIFLGVFLSGIWTPHFLLRERRPFLQRRGGGTIGSFLLGAAFTIGWTPCTGPILTAILLYAGSRETVSAGIVLLIAYIVGFALPFFCIMLLWQRIGNRVRQIYPYLPYVQKMAGAFLILFGILMFLGMTLRIFSILSTF